MVYRKGISEKTKALAYCLRENGHSFEQIATKCRISKTSAIRYANEEPGKLTKDRAKKSRAGRPRKLNERDVRHLVRSIDKLREIDVNFTVKKLVEFSGMDFKNVSYRTYVRCLAEHGYGYRQTRKKGVLSSADKEKRLAIAKKCKKKLSDDPMFFSKQIKLYLDGVSFVYKSNPWGEAMRPKARVWRRANEGLDVTAKGSKDLAGGKRLHMMVGIAYDKGVTIAEHYEHMDGRYFTSFIYNELDEYFAQLSTASSNHLFVMDNDPSQTSKACMEAISDIGAELFTIPARSPDINVIENVFHEVKKRLENEAITKQISKESFNEFKERVTSALMSVDVLYLNKTIDSFPKRVDAIIKGHGSRTKY